VLWELDADAFRWVLAHRSRLFDASMVALSYCGAYAWLAMAVLMGFVRPQRWSGVFQVILAIGLATLLTDTMLKPLFGRSRPDILDAEVEVIGVRQTNASFPSTHATNASAGAYALSRAFPAARSMWWVLAVLVAISRVYVGVHYPLDVISGGLVGLAAGWFVVGGTKWTIRDHPITNHPITIPLDRGSYE